MFVGEVNNDLESGERADTSTSFENIEEKAEGEYSVEKQTAYTSERKIKICTKVRHRLGLFYPNK